MSTATRQVASHPWSSASHCPPPSPLFPSYPSLGHVDALQACLGPPVMPATGLRLWPLGTKGGGGWGAPSVIFCCISSLGPRLSPPSLARRPRLPCSLIIQVSGSNVASSEVAKVAPPLCSVTVMFLALLSSRTHSVFVYLITAPPHPPPLPRLSPTKAGIWICLVHGCTPGTMAGTSWGLVTIY